MNDKPKDIPIAVKMPAEPGWYALVLEHDAEGKFVRVDPDSYRVVSIPVAAWGLVFNCDPMGLFLAMFGGGNSSNVKAHALGPDGQRLMSVKGFMGLQWPGETAQEAIDRIEAPAKEAAERNAQDRLRREAEREKRLDTGTLP
jgi:hypothetical protein